MPSEFVVEKIPLAEMPANDGFDHIVQPNDIISQRPAGIVGRLQFDCRQPSAHKPRTPFPQDITGHDPRAGMTGKTDCNCQIAGKMRRAIEKRRHDLAAETFIAEDDDDTIRLGKAP
jgi:hypothetical protein